MRFESEVGERKFNSLTQKLFETISEGDLFSVSKTIINEKSYGKMMRSFYASWGAEVDTQELVLVRMVLMNPFSTSKNNSYLSDFSIYVSELASELVLGVSGGSSPLE